MPKKVYSHENLLNVAVFLLWLASICGLIVFHKDAAKHALIRDSNKRRSVPLVVDIGFDIIMALTIVYFGYIWLGAFYVIHIFGSIDFWENMLPSQGPIEVGAHQFSN